MSRIFRYVLVHDSGMAPHPWEGMISLATCKPQVRQNAKVGEWVMGNRSAPHNHRVTWAGRVAVVMPVGEYAVQFAARFDALYPCGADGKPKRAAGKLPWYHPEQPEQDKDTRGNVLLFDPRHSWYFGVDARSLPSELEHLAHKGIGHSNRTDPSDITKLLAWLESESASGIVGKPRDPWPGPGRSPFDGSNGKPRRRC